MPYGSMQVPIGWNGLSMPTEGCSVYAHCQDSVPYIMEIKLTHISVKCGTVDPNVYCERIHDQLC